MPFRDYTFLGLTQSLCPQCLRLLPAKIIQRGPRVYFRKDCPRHGRRDDFVCSDARWFDRNEYSVPAKEPLKLAVESQRGCPFDCGLCEQHEQHTCIGLLEITESCNLTCPMCFAVSAPGGKHLTLQQCRSAIDALVAAEGQPEVLQLSGGEPTIHPQFLDIFDYACSQPIDYVLINTNGIRLARDLRLVEHLAAQRQRVEIYFQLDGLDRQSQVALRGEELLETKLRAIDVLGQAGLHVVLVCTLQPGVNQQQIGPLVQFGIERPWITGISFQPATYSGRYVLPEELESRVTFPDVIEGVARQSGAFQQRDFFPLPCAHPNAHSIAYAYRSQDGLLPLTRLGSADRYLDLLAGGISFTRPRAKQVIEQFLSRQCCGGDCEPATLQIEPSGAKFQAAGGADSGCGSTAQADSSQPPLSAGEQRLAERFVRRALSEDLGAADMFRITTTSFMDAYNFDVRQVIKSCVHHVLPSGHLIPFSAYNVLYRPGHVPLPQLKGRTAAGGSGLKGARLQT